MEIIKLFADIEDQTKKAVNNAGTASTASAAIGTILNSVYIIIGIVAVIFIIVGGVSYMTSQGDSNKLTKAKHTIMYSLIGLVIAVLAFAITTFILNQFTK